MAPWLNVIVWVVLGCLAAVSAASRGRSPAAWFLIGSILGWYGLLLLFILPPIASSEQGAPEKQKPAPSIPELTPEKPKEFIPTGEWFFLDRAKTICGPMTPQMLKERWQEGALLPSTWVWSESTVDWIRLAQLQPLLDWIKR